MADLPDTNMLPFAQAAIAPPQQYPQPAGGASYLNQLAAILMHPQANFGPNGIAGALLRQLLGQPQGSQGYGQIAGEDAPQAPYALPTDERLRVPQVRNDTRAGPGRSLNIPTTVPRIVPLVQGGNT